MTVVTHLSTCRQAFEYIYNDICIYIYVYIYVYIYIYMNIYVYIHMYIYTYGWWANWHLFDTATRCNVTVVTHLSTCSQAFEYTYNDICIYTYVYIYIYIYIYIYMATEPNGIWLTLQCNTLQRDCSNAFEYT